MRAITNDPTAWEKLVKLYAPLVFSWCEREGLTRSESEDVSQDVFVSISKDLKKFNPKLRGSFRGWVRTITRRRVIDFFRMHGKERAQVAEPDAVPAPSNNSNPPNAELSVLYQSAVDLIRSNFSERDYQAFHRVVAREQKPADVARELGMSLNSVYLARSRVLSRLKREFDGMIEELPEDTDV